MNACVVLLLCGVVGIAVGYYPQRQVPYNIGPNDPYSVVVNPNFLQEPSQRLFWGNQGSNQVGGSGTGLWGTLTNKFPFLGNMFGRMELPTEYGVPNQISTQYGPPQNSQPQYYQTPQYYQRPQTFQGPQYYQTPQTFQAPQSYQTPQTYQAPQFFQQPFFRQRIPSGRDVGFTDDAVIITPPQVPIGPQPAPVPAPAPAPAPQPVPEPSPEGYQYNKPQYRLELPHK